MADVAAAAALIASGRCSETGKPGSGTVPIAARLEAYKAKTLSRIFAPSASSEALAYRIAQALETEGDAAAFFRLPELIAALGPEDLARAARDGLAEGAMAWIALGDPGLLAALEKSGFSIMH
jgi:predicted Zn-dependent peptidase